MRLSHEDVQSVVSYGTATGGVTAGLMTDAALYMQHATILIALLVGLVRLAYDGIRLYRYLRRKHTNEQSD